MVKKCDVKQCKSCGRANPQIHNEFGSFCDEICFGMWQHKDKLRMMKTKSAKSE